MSTEEKFKQTELFQELVRNILNLPEDILNDLLDTCRKKMAEEMIQDIANDVHLITDHEQASKINNYLFQKYLL